MKLAFRLVTFLITVFASLGLYAADEKECIDGGKLMHLDVSNSGGYDITISRDKTFLVIGKYDGDSFKAFDLKTKQIKEFQKPSGSLLSILKNNEIAYSKFDGVDTSSANSVIKTLKKSKSTIIDFKTGQKKEITGKFVYGDSFYTPISYEGTSNIVLKGDTGKIKRISINNSTNIQMRHSVDSSDPDVSYNKNEATLEIKDNEKILYSGSMKNDQSNMITGLFSNNKKKFVTAIEQRNPDGTSKSNKIVVIDLDKKLQQSFEVPKDYSFNFFSMDNSNRKISKDSRYVLLNCDALPGKGIKALDLETGKFSIVAKSSIQNPYFDDSDNVCGEVQLYSEGKMVHECFNLKSGATVSRIGIPVSSGSVKAVSPTDFIVSSWGMGNQQEGQVYYFSQQKICPAIVTHVDCDCSSMNAQSKTENLEVIKDIKLAMNCSKSFDQADWKNLPSGDLSSLDEKSSLILLKRFSKPGGFEAEKHTGHLLGMLKVGLHKKYPAEFKGALGGVLYNSDRLYESLLTKYPEVVDLSEKSDQSCQTDLEKEKISKVISDFAKSRILSSPRPKFSDFKAIVSLAKDSLSEERKETLVEHASNQLIFSAGGSAELNRVFPSKVYKFSENKMKEALGMKYKNLTDLTVVRDSEKLVFYQLGIKPFSGSSETVAGFHIKPVKTVLVSDLPNNKSVENFTWNYSGQEYSAELGINKQQLTRPIVTQGKAPNYSEMWKGKEFRGVVIAGSNLGAGLTDNVMKEYIEYYMDQGFEFADPKISKDIPAYLQEGVSGTKPMHYLVKEAHSDGDEKNLFRVGKEGKILTGVRQIGDKKEIIDLVYPTGDAKSVLLSNQDFGSWIKSREKDGKPELVYLNSSCWSQSKAIYEISAAASPTLINIPTTSSMVTFTNDDKNVMHAAIDGLRNQKSYEGIREAMKKDSKYASKSSNVFIFPDEDEYKKNVTDVLKVPVDVSSKLFVKKPDGSQAPYSIEDTH